MKKAKDDGLTKKQRYIQKLLKGRESQHRYWTNNPEACVLANIKHRCKKKNIPFNLTIEDVTPPEFCPVLGIKLDRGSKAKRNFTSPNVDRIDPTKGYVKGNVVVVSALANRIKCHASPDQIIAVGEFYKSLCAERGIELSATKIPED